MVPGSVPEFTEQVSVMLGSSVPVRLTKGPRGFGFNIVGGSRPREFLQVYSITPGGPANLSPGTQSYMHTHTHDRGARLWKLGISFSFSLQKNL